MLCICAVCVAYLCMCVFCAHVCVCVCWSRRRRQLGLPGAGAGGPPLPPASRSKPFIAQSLRVGKLGRRRWRSSEFARREVGASPMALLFPIPGVSGRVFAANEQSAWDEEVLRTLQPSLIINLTRKPCPGCALICLF